jgi:hypothetical protein
MSSNPISQPQLTNPSRFCSVSSGTCRNPAQPPSSVEGSLKANSYPRGCANYRSYRGFNFFDDDGQKLFRTIARGEFNISGFQNKNLRRHLPEWDTAKVCRILKRLRVHGLIKKIGSTYKYYLTHLGHQVVAAGLKLKTLFLVPELSATPLHCRS